ncbi:MAG: Fe-S cluster assembly protein SufD [Hyphomicrobiales bacterium]|nr:Fe-S cluster assembly protein SufD [Hyphomicrobiales bacterium]
MEILAPTERRRTRAETDLETAFSSFVETYSGDVVDRAGAFARFSTAGLPHRRVEAYHFTDLRSMLASAPVPAAPTSRSAGGADLFVGLGAARAVFVDGFFRADLSDLSGLGDGVAVTTIAAGLAANDPALAALGGRVSADPAVERDPLVALASAFYGDGLIVRVAAGAVAARPLEIRHLSSGASVSAFVRHAVVVGEGASIEVIESHESPDGVEIHAHTLTELTLAAGAKAVWLDRQREGDQAARFSTLAVDLGKRAAFDHSVVTLGAKLARTQIFARLGEAADLSTRGATLVKGRSHADATLVVTHAEPHAVSRELYKSAVDGEAVSVFQGRIVVEKKAQGTDGRMGAHAVLLSDRAEAKAKPELEIFADDVACAHGATVAEIDETLKFYLMSRGIPAAETDKLLIRAFLGEVTDAIGSEGAREAIEAEIDGWIDARGDRT